LKLPLKTRDTEGQQAKAV